MNDTLNPSHPEDCRYVLWVNYGPEGWKPRGFDTLGEISTAILESSYGSAVVPTRRLLVDLREF